MDFETLKSLAIAFSALLSIGSAIAVYMNSPGRKFEEALTKLTTLVAALEDQIMENLKGHDRRIQAIEGELKHIPSAMEVGRLNTAVAALDKDVSHLAETMRSMNHTVMRIDDHLREKS